jgi:CHAT domain-containing protein
MTDRCLNPQTLAAFADRTLPRAEIPAVLAHLEECPDCMSVLKAAVDLREENRVPDRRWLAVAAAVALLAISAFLLRRMVAPTGVERLVRLAPQSARTVEARLSGAFAYAPYRGPLRGSAESTPQRMKLVGATGELVERADADPTPAAQHAAGLGLVLVDQPEQAIARLRTAAEHSPADAASWNDLAAAEYATALQQHRASLYPVALAHADRALRIDPKRGEALFNRALILERLGLTQAAREAWDRFLAADPSSPWSAEAREHRSRLSASTSDLLFQGDRPLLESAASRGDAATVARLVREYPQQSRSWGEAEYLGRWGEAEATVAGTAVAVDARTVEDGRPRLSVTSRMHGTGEGACPPHCFEVRTQLASTTSGDSADAARQLATARAIGEALVAYSGESLLRDAVAAIDHAAPEQRARLARAHALYRRARMAYGRHDLVAAEPELRAAAAQFEAAHSPMALAARYFAACARFDGNDAVTARRELEALSAETHSPALGAQVRWELALCTILDEDWSASETLLREAAGTFATLGERSNLAVMKTLLAATLISLGRPDEGWTLRAEAFAIQSGEGRGEHVALSIGDAARIELRTGRRESAAALLELEEAAHRAAGDDVQLSNALVRHASMLDGDAASRVARLAAVVAERIADPALRARAIADARFAEGTAVVQSSPGVAFALLSEAVEHYRGTGKSFYLPEALLARARASLRSGDAGAAVRDLEAGIGETDRHRAVVSGNVTGTGVLDARRALLDELIPLLLDRRDPEGAFAAAQRTHAEFASGEGVAEPLPCGGQAPSPVQLLRDRGRNDEPCPPRTGVIAAEVATLQRKLAGSGAMVLELVVLPREVIAFAVTEAGLEVTRRTVNRETLTALAGRDDDDALRQLHELLIRPAEASLAHARELIVIADAALQNVPFGALLDGSNRRLLESLPVATALRAATLERAEHAGAPHSVVVVSLPTGEGNGTSLPEAETELASAGSYYGNVRTLGSETASLAALRELARGADVIHIAGHTERQPGAGDPALLFRGPGPAAERVPWTRIAATDLGSAIVVLAACETLRVPPSPSGHALSLGGGFLAAGATAAIGTLTPIPDNDARDLFRAIHRQLAAGRSPAAALQQTQLDAIRDEAHGHVTAWRSLAVLTNRIDVLIDPHNSLHNRRSDL